MTHSSSPSLRDGRSRPFRNSWAPQPDRTGNAEHRCGLYARRPPRLPVSEYRREQRVTCERLLRAVGNVIWLQNEEFLDVATAVAGSGPPTSSVWPRILPEAGVAFGLSTDVAHQLARETLCGAGELAYADQRKLSELRIGCDKSRWYDRGCPCRDGSWRTPPDSHARCSSGREKESAGAGWSELRWICTVYGRLPTADELSAFGWS